VRNHNSDNSDQVPAGPVIADPLAGGDLAAFICAVEAGTLRGAADALNMTQSAVTKRIQALERRLGAEVLERGRFGARPTSLGAAIYAPAKRALAALGDVAGAAAEHSREGASELSLIASLTIGELLLPGWLGRFRETRPDVRPRLVVINSQSVLGALRSGSAEIGFFEGIGSLSGLRTLRVARDEIVTAVAPGHPWARRRSIRAAQLPGERYLTREAASGTRAVVNRALAERGIALEPTAEIASLQSLKRALADGGFTLISNLAIEEERRRGALVALPVADLNLRRDLFALARRRPALSEPARSFWRWLEVAVAAELG
jgi:DNA-binding transcriptional LysR family regulator